MDVWKALENAENSVQRKIERIERARDSIPFEGSRGISVANVLTNFASTLSEVERLIACLLNLKDTSIAKGNAVKTVDNTYWKFYNVGNKVFITRHDPAISVVVSDEAVTISLKRKGEKGLSATFKDSEFSIKKDKLEVGSNYSNYQYLLDNMYYINYALRPIARALKRRVPALTSQLKMLGVQCS